MLHRSLRLGMLGLGFVSSYRVGTTIAFRLQRLNVNRSRCISTCRGTAGAAHGSIHLWGRKGAEGGDMFSSSALHGGRRGGGGGGGRRGGRGRGSQRSPSPSYGPPRLGQHRCVGRCKPWVGNSHYCGA